MSNTKPMTDKELKEIERGIDNMDYSGATVQRLVEEVRRQRSVLDQVDVDTKQIDEKLDRIMVNADMKCQKCDGCGQVANTSDQEPWTRWLDIPFKSATAVMLKIVQPVTCPACGGSGVAVPLEVQAKIIRGFVERVNARAEANIARTNKLEGSHYAAMRSLLAEMDGQAK